MSDKAEDEIVLTSYELDQLREETDALLRTEPQAALQVLLEAGWVSLCEARRWGLLDG